MSCHVMSCHVRLLPFVTFFLWECCEREWDRSRGNISADGLNVVVHDLANNQQHQTSNINININININMSQRHGVEQSPQRHKHVGIMPISISRTWVCWTLTCMVSVALNVCLMVAPPTIRICKMTSPNVVALLGCVLTCVVDVVVDVAVCSNVPNNALLFNPIRSLRSCANSARRWTNTEHRTQNTEHRTQNTEQNGTEHT